MSASVRVDRLKDMAILQPAVAVFSGYTGDALARTGKRAGGNRHSPEAAMFLAQQYGIRRNRTANIKLAFRDDHDMNGFHVLGAEHDFPGLLNSGS